MKTQENPMANLLKWTIERVKPSDDGVHRVLLVDDGREHPFDLVGKLREGSLIHAYTDLFSPPHIQTPMGQRKAEEFALGFAKLRGYDYAIVNPVGLGRPDDYIINFYISSRKGSP